MDPQNVKAVQYTQGSVSDEVQTRRQLQLETTMISHFASEYRRLGALRAVPPSCPRLTPVTCPGHTFQDNIDVSCTHSPLVTCHSREDKRPECWRLTARREEAACAVVSSAFKGDKVRPSRALDSPSLSRIDHLLIHDCREEKVNCEQRLDGVDRRQYGWVLEMLQV